MENAPFTPVRSVDGRAVDFATSSRSVESSADFFLGGWLEKHGVICAVKFERVIARSAGGLGVAGYQFTLSVPVKPQCSRPILGQSARCFRLAALLLALVGDLGGNGIVFINAGCSQPLRSMLGSVTGVHWQCTSQVTRRACWHESSSMLRVLRSLTSTTQGILSWICSAVDFQTLSEVDTWSENDVLIGRDGLPLGVCIVVILENGLGVIRYTTSRIL